MLDFDRFPRFRLAQLPTPMHRLERLSTHLGGPEIWIKRDDLTGLGEGGNKLRKLEFVVADALASGADTLVSIGAVQSNHTRQTAAAAARAGLGCVLIQERWVPGLDADQETLGNVLLSRLLGAEVRIVDGAGLWRDDEGPDTRVRRVALELRRAGRSPYVVPVGASDHPLGGLGYASCATELGAVEFRAIVHASGSGGTQAGLVAGLHSLGAGTEVIGVDVNAEPAATHGLVSRLAAATAAPLGGALPADAVRIEGGYAGPAYGVLTPEALEAIRLVGRLEGILLDPVYEGKSMAALIGLIADGEFERSDRVLFMHLGGTPALHAYRHQLL